MKELRENSGISQARLAKSMTEFGFRMVQSTIAKMERDEDRRPISLGEAVMLSFILGEELDNMLIGPLGEESEAVETMRDQVKETEAEIISMIEDYERLRADYQDKLGKRIQLLKEKFKGPAAGLMIQQDRARGEELLKEAMGELYQPEHMVIARFMERDNKVIDEDEE